MKRTKISAAAFAMSACLLWSCSGKEAVQEEKEEKPGVKIATVHQQPVDQTGTYTATVEADVVNNISANMQNRIKQIYVDEGMRVARGQKLVVLDDVNSTTYQLQLDNAKAQLANTETDYNRALELFKIGGGTKQSVDQMQTQLINAKNAVASAERALRNVRENTILTSPISGIVTARNYDPGDITGALPILTVAQVQPVKIVINVSESELSKVKTGMPATITFDTYADEQFTGKITMVSPTVDPDSRTFGVEITLANPNNKILPGMFGRVTLNYGTIDRVVVPDRAVVKQQGSGNHYIYIYKDGKVSYTKVELGQRLGDTYELISGVPSGSEVVIYGQNRLSNGTDVHVIK